VHTSIHKWLPGSTQQFFFLWEQEKKRHIQTLTNPPQETIDPPWWHTATIHSPGPMVPRRPLAKNTKRTAPGAAFRSIGQWARTHVAIAAPQSNRIQSGRELWSTMSNNWEGNQSVSPARTRPLADGHPRTAADAGPCGPPGRTCRPLRRRPLLPQPRRSSSSSSLSGGGSSAGNAARARRGEERFVRG